MQTVVDGMRNPNEEIKVKEFDATVVIRGAGVSPGLEEELRQVQGLVLHDVDNDVEIVKFDESHASDILAVPGSALSYAGCFDCVAGLHGHGAWSSALSLSPQAPPRAREL